MRLRTTTGTVEVEVAYGQDPADGRWICPMRERWGLAARQRVSPELEQRLCLTATLAGSFEAAAQVAAAWGTPVDSATIYRTVQRVGQRAEQLQTARVERALEPATRGEVVAEAAGSLASGPVALVIMMDGWLGRQRGSQWGLKPPQQPAERVAWKEVKAAIIFRLDQRAVTQSRRRLIVRKYYQAWCGTPEELGRRVYAEALRRGLNQARKVYVVADGAVWIWNLAADRLAPTLEVLDIYHAKEHLWAVAHELYGADEAAARRWVAPLIGQLQQGAAQDLVGRLTRLAARLQKQGRPCAATAAREAAYFETHRERLQYPRARAEGCPIGSGAMESTCAQLQTRFKRPGQFWSPPGQRRLLELEMARRNDDWDELWQLAA